ncbi:unnamed protein product [Adineta steineri]|uniref:G-protein coupled receptors family 1 profile domain-containing protein n=1 Tax=Adineta steineri TaxID=433720 RepID=A0A814HLZ4_9BILA|nr:unnamed protein product [Adineta steineri]
MGNFPSTSSNVPFFWPKFEFSLILFGVIISIPCYLFVFYHLLTERNRRKSLHNHAMVILLFYNFLIVTVDLTMTLDFNRLGYVQLFTPAICLIWQFIDHGIWYGAVSVMFWTSFERHILIFYPNLVATTRKRLFIHYIPLAFFSLYTPMLFFYLIFLHSCGQTYVTTKIRCGSICLYIDAPNWLQQYDSYIDYVLPVLLIGICSITLLFRYIRQKQRMQQAVTWRRCRKMTLQLVLVSAVYNICDLPAIIVFIIQSSGNPTFASNIWSPFLTRLTLIPSIIVPFAVLLALPELKRKLLALCIWKRNQRIIVPGITIN